MSKLTRTLNCSVSFFPNHCLIQDLSTKQIISRGRESGGLYILETEVLKSVACSEVVTPIRLTLSPRSSFSPFVEEVMSSVF